MKIEIKEIAPESDLGNIQLSNGIDIWWGMSSCDSPKTKSEALELASFICAALNKSNGDECPSSDQKICRCYRPLSDVLKSSDDEC